jgi:hypothetical protein
MSVLRDVSLILLALEGAAFTLVILALLGAINYGLIRFRWWHTIPGWFALAWGYLRRGQQIIGRICRLLTAPIFAVYVFQAKLSARARGLADLGRELTGRD